MKIIVSGTGFSSILCIKYLLKLGIKPTVFDVGNEIDAQKKMILKKESLIKQKDFDIFLCKGGLSEVWSGVIEKYSENDFHKWPMSRNNFELYYNEALKNLKDHDLYSFTSKLKNDFLNYELKKSENYKDYEIFRNENISIKYSNILGKKFKNGDLPTYGDFKPYNLKNIIDELIKNQEIDYKKEKILKVYEEANQVFIESINNSNTINKTKCDYLFMGTGCISTYLIMKNSLPNFGNDIKIKSSKQFVLPVKFNKINDFKYKFFNSLPIFQLNLIKNKDYSLYSQIYNLNPNIINYFFPKVVNYKSYFFLLNLLKNYGFSYFNLGSEYSDSFIFDKNLNLKIYEKKYKVSNILNLETGIFKKSFLNNQFFHINIPIKMKSLSGNHFGSCFPMDKYRKNIYSSDLYGRIGQFKKISITDSSVFPELSARPPTLTILANSLRIVTEVSKLNFFNT